MTQCFCLPQPGQTKPRGYSALLTITTLDGEDRMILLDTGWNTD